MTQSTPKPKDRVQILLLALIALWCTSLIIAAIAGRHATTTASACRTNLKMTQSLSPEIDVLASYDKALSTIADKTFSATATPSFRMVLAEKNAALMPDTLEENFSTLDSSRLRMITALAKWNSITEEDLSAIITLAESAPSAFRLGNITLSPSGRGDSLKVEASFISFSK